MDRDKIVIRGLRQNNLKNVSLDIPKGKIFDCMRALGDVDISAPVTIGQVVLQNIAGTGVDVVATKNVSAK